MATFVLRLFSFFSFYMFILLISKRYSNVECVRTKEKIYIDLQTQNACFRILNSTHQVGCSSKVGGNVGVLHYVEEEEDYEWVLHNGPHTPYIVLMTSVDFNKKNVERLVNSGRVNGILVLSILKNTTVSPIPTDGFSADKACPNDNYGVYHNSTEYKNCKKVEWNAVGEGLYFNDYHDFPMFAVSNVSDFDILVHQCYRKFNQPINGTARSFPVCAVQLSDRMNAAKDSITCMRRTNHMTNLNPTSYCSALGDQNIVATTKMVEQNETRPEKSVIVVSTRMDSFSMFEYEYQNSDTTVTGIVALLAAAKALKPVHDELKQANNDIMFAFFQGEAFDYIGSSRMIYEMEENNFPYKIKKDIRYPQNINISHISHFIELSQLGFQDDGNLWIHSDPISRGNDKKVSDEVANMINVIKAVGETQNVSLHEVVNQPLPPASVQRFLKKSAIPSIVITDHKQQYTNKYYNSRFDLSSFINASYPEGLNETEKYNYITEQAKSLANIATTISQFLYKLSTGKVITHEIEQKIKADELEIAHMLYCFLENPVCELFKQSISPDDKKNLAFAKKPFPFYVSVELRTNQVTGLVYSILAQYLGEQYLDSKDNCSQPDADKRYTYIWMQGSLIPGKIDREGWCVKSTTLLSKAKSPAFIIKDYDWLSGEYSTWTESDWVSFKVRVFLIPSESQKTLTLALGVVISLSSILLLYFINDRASLIFSDSHSTTRNYY